MKKKKEHKSNEFLFVDTAIAAKIHKYVI